MKTSVRISELLHYKLRNYINKKRLKREKVSQDEVICQSLEEFFQKEVKQ